MNPLLRDSELGRDLPARKLALQAGEWGSDKQINVINVFMKKFPPLLTLLIFPLLFSGCSCIGTVEEYGCSYVDGKTQDHCYQDAAKRKNSFDTCDKIKAESFNAIQGPAPKDKCYLLVAEQTGDPSGCERIQGGAISYSKAECYTGAAKTAGDAGICDMIKDDDGAKEECKNQF